MSIIRVLTNHLELDNSVQINSASDNTSYYDPNYVDGYIFASTKNNSTRYHIRNLEYSGNSIWYHFRFNSTSSDFTGTSVDTWVILTDKYDRILATVGKSSSSSNSVRLRVHGTSIVTSASTYSVPTGTSFIDIHYEQVGITANLSLYINGALQETVTNTDIGNLQKCIHISGNPDAFAYTSTNRAKGRMSELIIADEDTRGLRVAKLKQSAPGTYSDFTGDVADLDTYVKEDFLNANTVGQKVSWEPTAYLGAAGNVKYVGVSSMAQHHAGSPNSLQHFLRMGGVDHKGADIRTKFDGIVQQFWATNPETSGPWVTADLADIDEVGAESSIYSEAVQYERTAWLGTTRSMHSGHSLTDAYYGSPQGDNDGYLTEIRDSLLSPATGDSGTYMFKNTFGGSSMEDRWDGNSLARSDIGNYDALMITEAGPPPHLALTTSRVFGDINTRWDRWLKFVANTIENGAAPEVILWSIWPGTDIATGSWSDDWEGVSFDDALVEYGQIYETMADYATFKMKDLYPSLPPDWRVWLIPGHRFWQRIVADLATNSVPTVTTLDELLPDTIHPDGRAQYGLACLVYTCLYQVDLREQTGVFVPDGFDPDLRDYFWQIAFEIATAYEPVGMGGTQSEGSLWTEGVDPDFMPDWTLAAADLTPGWAEIVPSGLDVVENVAISGSLIEGTLHTMSSGTWTNTPSEQQFRWGLNWSVVAETQTFTPGYGTAGQELAGWFRARVAGGPWTTWFDPSGGGTMVQAWQCNMTTSTYDAGSGNVLTGFNSGQGLPAFGSINREPIPGLTFLGFWHNELNNQLAIAFAGDQMATLTGMKVYLDANAATAAWTYYASGTPFNTPVTMMLLSGQIAIPASTYSIRIAP